MKCKLLVMGIWFVCACTFAGAEMITESNLTGEAKGVFVEQGDGSIVGIEESSGIDMLEGLFPDTADVVLGGEGQLEFLDSMTAPSSAVPFMKEGVDVQKSALAALSGKNLGISPGLNLSDFDGVKVSSLKEGNMVKAPVPMAPIVPEPATMALVGLGLSALVLRGWKQKNQT